MNDFHVNLSAMRDFAKYLADECGRVPQSERVAGEPGFGHRSHWGAHTMWRSHSAARNAMLPLLDQIKGGSLSSEAAVHKVIENYVTADDTAKERMEAVNRAVGGLRKDASAGDRHPASGQEGPDEQGQSGPPGQPAPSPSPSPEPSQGPDQPAAGSGPGGGSGASDADDVLGPYGG